MKVPVGEKIKKARKEAGLTLQQLADLIGAKRKQVVSNWEHGFGRPNLEMLEKLAQTLNVSLEYFFDREGLQNALFTGANEEVLLLDVDGPLVEAFHKNQRDFESGEAGARVSVQMVVDAAKDRESFFESHPYMEPFWTLMYKLATEQHDVSQLLKGAKLSNEQVAFIADAIRKIVPKKLNKIS